MIKRTLDPLVFQNQDGSSSQGYLAATGAADDRDLPAGRVDPERRNRND